MTFLLRAEKNAPSSAGARRSSEPRGAKAEQAEIGQLEPIRPLAVANHAVGGLSHAKGVNAREEVVVDVPGRFAVRVAP